MAEPTPSERRMALGEHLEELRNRVFKAVFACFLGAAGVWHWREQLFAWLLRPFEVAWYCRYRESLRAACAVQDYYAWMAHPARFESVRAVTARLHPATNPSFTVFPEIHFPDPAAGFIAYVKIAAIGGLVVALPVVFYQLWSFIAPGLYPREKKYVLPFVFFSTGFFLAGAAFGYYFVFPVGHEFFLGFGGRVPGTQVTVVPTIMMDEYLGFTSQMLLAFGIVFELPLFVFFLSLAGVVTWLQLLKFGRYFTVLAFILAAILTPTPDIFSQVMLGAPLVILYFVAVGLAYLFGARKQKPSKFTGNQDPQGPPATGAGPSLPPPSRGVKVPTGTPPAPPAAAAPLPAPPAKTTGPAGSASTPEEAARIRAAKVQRAQEQSETEAGAVKTGAWKDRVGKGLKRP